MDTRRALAHIQRATELLGSKFLQLAKSMHNAQKAESRNAKRCTASLHAAVSDSRAVVDRALSAVHNELKSLALR